MIYVENWLEGFFFFVGVATSVVVITLILAIFGYILQIAKGKRKLGE